MPIVDRRDEAGDDPTDDEERATIAGEAPASAIIRDLLKSDELVALPKADEVTIAPLIDTSKRSPEDQAILKAKRAETKAAKKDADRARRAQSAVDRKRS